MEKQIAVQPPGDAMPADGDERGAHEDPTSESYPVEDRTWRPDVLGTDFDQLTLCLEPDDEGPAVATLVRHRPRRGRGSRQRGGKHRQAVLYLHGWNEYFFARELAEFFTAHGRAFYALDLRKYGRSLRPWTTPGYTDDLAVYDADIAAAIEAIEADLGGAPDLSVMGHSTGGLIAALWAQRRPNHSRALILSSPWLELQGKAALRLVATPGVGLLAWQSPKTELPNVDLGFAHRTIARDTGGEWDFDTAWRPNPQFPVRPGWLEAILAGHAEVAKGLDLEIPVLLMTSDKSIFARRWRDEMRHADVVLDVDAIVGRAANLGRLVTLARIPGALHEIVLSAPPVRAYAYQVMAQWAKAYLDPAPT